MKLLYIFSLFTDSVVAAFTAMTFFFFEFLLMSDLGCAGSTPPPAMVALMSVSAPRHRGWRAASGGGDALHLKVLARVAGELEDLGGEVLEDGRGVHGGGGADALADGDLVLQETVDAAHRELAEKKSSRRKRGIRKRRGRRRGWGAEVRTRTRGQGSQGLPEVPRGSTGRPEPF